jgi:hypothetical protein
MRKGISTKNVIGLAGLLMVIGLAVFIPMTLDGPAAQARGDGPTNTLPVTTELAESSTESPGMGQTLASEEAEATPAAGTVPTAAYSHPDPENWKSWPVFPVGLSEAMREVHARGQENGLNDQAFSILGDCQSEPDLFMGVYDRDPAVVAALAAHLRETVAHFKGSFDRYSPTVAGGTTEGALLWHAWNTNEEGYCQLYENPLQCELRYHQPIIAFIHVGTHWEARNEQYLREIIEILIDNGTVPVVVTKADNRELDERVNSNYVRLAAEYELPVWNFWASVQDLPNQGMVLDSDMYLTDEALAVHRLGALEMLDWLYRALQE